MRSQPTSIELGIRGEYVAPGDHIAYFWDTRADFERGIDFLELGLPGEDHGVIFGHSDANAEVLRILGERGLDTGALEAGDRLTVLGGLTAGDATGASCIRSTS